MIAEPVIEERDGVLIVRDDLIEGGTKRRVIDSILTGFDEYVYASPAAGYAQVALAYGCAANGKRATVFVAKRAALHKRTEEAKAAGAKIVQIPYGYLSNVQAKAKAYAALTGACYIPFGFDSEPVLEGLADIARALPVKPAEVWTVAGSGLLTRALQRAWPAARFFAVKIGSTPKAGAATVYDAPEKFEQDAKIKPPFPSCSNYDAKAWRFIKQHASPGALFWNVAA
jgi:threonine dehydratase